MIPFVRGFDDPRYQIVSLVCGAQMAKTEALLDVIGQRFDQRPTSTIFVAPTKNWLQKELEPRLMAMIDEAPSLTKKLARGKRNNQFRKVIGGVPVRLIWAGSATEMSGVAAGLVLLDELDRMSADVKGEGDPLTLALARGYAYRDAKYGVTATPLEGSVDIEHDEASGLYFWKKMPADDVTSPIWKLFQSGTMFHWSWPCPHCKAYFIPRFRNLKWPDGATAARAKREAYLECPCCQASIHDSSKSDMNARGVYVAPGQTITRDGVVVGDPPDATVLSFWVSGLCSPFQTFGQRAAAFLDAKDSGLQTKIQTIINTGFGELWSPGGGDAPEWAEVAAHKREYKSGTLPEGAKLLTMTVDVQRRGLFYVIRGWGREGTSWLIEHGELPGDTAGAEIWDDLAALITTPIVDDKRLKLVLIDSGYRPGKPVNLPINRIYEFCRRFPRLVRATKGRDTQAKPVKSSNIEVKSDGHDKPYGLELLWLDTDFGKCWVHERIRWPMDKPGAWYLPGDITIDYCKQIVSEARVRRPSGRPGWVQHNRANHFLDCEAMQAACAHLLNVHLIERGQRSKPLLTSQPPKQPIPGHVPAPPVAAATVDAPTPSSAPLSGRRSPTHTPGLSRGSAIARLYRR